MELAAGVPANWLVLVVGVIVDWAFAAKVANAMKTARQNKTAANFPRETDLLGVNNARLAEGLTFWPSCPGNLGSRNLFLTFKKASSKLPGYAICSTIYIRKALRTVRVKTKEQSIVLEIHLQRFTSGFLAQKKRVNEQTRYLEQRKSSNKISGLSSFESLGLPGCGCTPAVLAEVI